MQEPIADGVGEGGLADSVVPVFDGALAGDDGRGLAMAVLDDLQQVVALGIGQGGEKQIIEDEQLDFGQPGESF